MAVTFTSQYLSPLWSGTKNTLHNYANFVLGVDQSEIFSKELQRSVRGTKDSATKKYVGGKGFTDLGGSIKSAWNTSKKAVENKSLWTVIKDSFGKIPGEFKAASRLVAKTGKTSKYFGSTLKILGKRMPLIGNLVFVATEIPNICNAFSKGGVATGVGETLKAAGKMGGFAAGAAIGQALIPIPFVGALIGGVVGSFVADKVLGKSFTEKQEEAQAKQAQAQAQQTEPAQTQVQAQAAETKAAPATQQTQTATQQIQPQMFQSTKSQQGLQDAQREMMLQQAYASAGMNPFSNSYGSPFDQPIGTQQFGYNSYSSNPMGMMGNQFNQYGQSGYLNIASNPFLKNKLQGANNNTAQ